MVMSLQTEERLPGPGHTAPTPAPHCRNEGGPSGGESLELLLQRPAEGIGAGLLQPVRDMAGEVLSEMTTVLRFQVFICLL